MRLATYIMADLHIIIVADETCYILADLHIKVTKTCLSSLANKIGGVFPLCLIPFDLVPFDLVPFRLTKCKKVSCGLKH